MNLVDEQMVYCFQMDFFSEDVLFLKDALEVALSKYCLMMVKDGLLYDNFSAVLSF